MRYVALLRGINVGGNSKVEMPRLKKLFEKLGFNDVKTYINSGNVVFTGSGTAPALTAKIEKAIEKEFKLKIRVVVQNLDAIKKIAKATPEKWLNDASMKTDVMFLWNEIDSKRVLKEIPIKPEVDAVRYVKGALIWNVERKNITRSGMLKIIGTPIYKMMTIRNVNTLRKLLAIMETR